MMQLYACSSMHAVFFPGALWAARKIYQNVSPTGSSQGKRRRHTSQATLVVFAAIILLQPALVLIDHGHFQYNCIGLGLTVRL
jgi:alpha-1,3-glucosyltransferase